MSHTHDRWASLAKVELHRHLDCSIRPSTLRELLVSLGEKVPSSEEAFRAEYLVTEPMQDLASVLKKFLAAQKALASGAILERITRECIEDAVREGIRILELRYAPTFIAEDHPQLNFEKIHQSILRGIEACKHLPIVVGLIATIQRTKPVALGASVVDFVIEHRESFVAIDLADNEDGFDAKPFAAIFQRAKAKGLHVTIHAGEALMAGSAQNVLSAIEYLGAERIGHGIQIANTALDPKSVDVLKEVVRRKIPLEVCPTSNVLTNAAPSIAAHPFRKLFEAGVPLSINTDDPGIFDLTLKNEYDVLADSLGFTLEEFTHINQVAAESSFIPLAQRQRVWTL